MKHVILALSMLTACGDTSLPPGAVATHSSSIALSPAGDRLFVVNADTDSVSVIDPASRSLLAEIALGTPMLDPAIGAYTPSVIGLELDAIEQVTAHGELMLTLFVLPRTDDDGTQTDCGPGTTEDVQIEF